MLTVVMVVLGLCLGSFVNAFVWRLHWRATATKKSILKDKQFSLLHGRSMCPNCYHQLSALDLIPVLSWIGLGGKCRYCKKPISIQYPLAEIMTAALFVFSYIFWPTNLRGEHIFIFTLWLIFITAFMALAIYDLRWSLLPNKIVYSLIGLAVLEVVVEAIISHDLTHFLLGLVFSLLLTAGLFLAIFILSNGKWIGGGDVKLLVVIGLLLASPAEAIFMVFLASVLGTITSVPLMFGHKLKIKSVIPFGPFLITSTVITYLFGASIIAWYRRMLVM
jgi:prepilin signal peptidase PulO-like enzyme (type II secretory pathway)